MRSPHLLSIAAFIIGFSFIEAVSQTGNGNYVAVQASTTGLKATPSSNCSFSFIWGGITTITGNSSHTVEISRGVEKNQGDMLYLYSDTMTLTDQMSMEFDLSVRFSITPVSPERRSHYQGMFMILVDLVDAANGELIHRTEGLGTYVRYGSSADTTIDKTCRIDRQKHQDVLKGFYGRQVKFKVHIATSPIVFNNSRPGTLMDITFSNGKPSLIPSVPAIK